MDIYKEIAHVFRKLTIDGGPGSGNFSHGGRPGQVGGSSENPSSNNPPDKRIFGSNRITEEKDHEALKEMTPTTRKFYDHYVKNEQKVTNDVEKVFADNKMKMVGEAFALKMPSSVKRKIELDMKDKGISEDQAIAELHDVVRYTALSSAENLVKDAQKTLKDMEAKGYQVVQIKNTWMDKNNPYHGINVKVKSPDGLKMEVQFHTPQSFDMKEHKQHKMYEEYRLDTTPEDRKAELSKAMWNLITNNTKWNIPKNIEKFA